MQPGLDLECEKTPAVTLSHNTKQRKMVVYLLADTLLIFSSKKAFALVNQPEKLFPLI